MCERECVCACMCVYVCVRIVCIKPLNHQLTRLVLDRQVQHAPLVGHRDEAGVLGAEEARGALKHALERGMGLDAARQAKVQEALPLVLWLGVEQGERDVLQRVPGPALQVDVGRGHERVLESVTVPHLHLNGAQQEACGVIGGVGWCRVFLPPPLSVFCAFVRTHDSLIHTHTHTHTHTCCMPVLHASSMRLHAPPCTLKRPRTAPLG